jgi:predicted ferric reductase
MLALSLVHTATHLLNYSTLPRPMLDSLFLTQAGLTGLLLLLVFVVMAYCETKRGKNFELFYFSHLGFVAWFILALLHGPVFWKWPFIPIAAYGIERWIRFRSAKQPSTIENIVLFPSRVTNLQIARPPGFDYRPGDYVFIRIPAISRFEWHPFTISSGPEDPHTFSVHIRNSGNWTNTVYEYFLELEARGGGIKTPVHLDGPYGAPSSQSLDSEIAILIGAGIGVTPCASILQSILHQHQSKSGRGGALKRVHFFWLNRDQQSFEWFSELLRQLESEDIEGFLDINIYMTGARADMKSSTLNIAMDLLHRRLKVDLVTGLQARTNMGHAKWEQVFDKLAQQYRGQPVDVYFCGPPGLSATLKRNAQRVGFNYHKENF